MWYNATITIYPHSQYLVKRSRVKLNSRISEGTEDFNITIQSEEALTTAREKYYTWANSIGTCLKSFFLRTKSQLISRFGVLS